jgi:hypothetical protein
VALPTATRMAMRWLVFYFVYFLPLQISVAQTQKQKHEDIQPQRLVVKVLDGFTGLPMWFEFPNVWIGSHDDTVSRLDVRGEAEFDVTNSKPRVIRLSSNWYADCRYEGDARGAGSNIEYSIDEVLQHGIVTDSVCSSRHAKPKPGEIIFYVRRRTLKEIIAL